MSIFDKITSATHFYDNSSKEQVKEYLFPPEKEEEIRNLIKESARNIFPQPNDDVEFIIPFFNAKKHYKHLKKMMWKYRR